MLHNLFNVMEGIQKNISRNQFPRKRKKYYSTPRRFKIFKLSCKIFISFPTLGWSAVKVKTIIVVKNPTTLIFARKLLLGKVFFRAQAKLGSNLEVGFLFPYRS